MVPTDWWLLDSFPVTGNGKLDVRVLDRLPVPADPDDVPVGPRTATELAVHDLWCDVLGRSRVGVITGFFAAGGHSLAALRIAGRAEKRFGRPVALAEVLGRATIAEFAAWLDDTVPGTATTERNRPARQRRQITALPDDLDLATDEELAVLRSLTGLDPTSQGANQ
ncbi:phosphopantetheine-binding protein [Streptomyces chartreusis]|uniref:phosphopantetheine-binding protein n=1 Tax=Streptomyces chartreusis TaxID=1969 RepID=UPI00368E5DDB